MSETLFAFVYYFNNAQPFLLTLVNTFFVDLVCLFFSFCLRPLPVTLSDQLRCTHKSFPTFMHVLCYRLVIAMCGISPQFNLPYFVYKIKFLLPFVVSNAKHIQAAKSH